MLSFSRAWAGQTALPQKANCPDTVRRRSLPLFSGIQRKGIPGREADLCGNADAGRASLTGFIKGAAPLKQGQWIRNIRVIEKEDPTVGRFNIIDHYENAA